MAWILRRAGTRSRAGWSVTPAPVAVQYTPDSILSTPTAHTPTFVGRRRRLVACSGVAWFHDWYIATVNLLGNARFDPSERTFTPVQALAGMAGLAHPENLAFSPDGDLLAITNAEDGGSVNLYGVGRDTHLIDPTPVVTIKGAEGVNGHGVSFSPCGRFLAFTTVEDPGRLRLYRVGRDAHGRVEAVSFQDAENRLAPLKPKGIDFAPDGRVAAVCYAPNAGPEQREPHGLLAIYPFSAATGLDAEPLGEGSPRRACAPDDVRFCPDGSHLLLTNQNLDTAEIVAVDRETGKLRGRRVTLANPQARLSFPHGAAVSRDGAYLAIASYGDDKVTVYATTAAARS